MIDIDMLVIQNMDHLFELNAPAALKRGPKIYKNGEKVDDLAFEFNLSPNSIRKWLKDKGVTSIRGGSKVGSSEILQISKLQREKQQLLEIIGELTVLTRQSKKKSS
jgi:hypothetical protein